MHIHDLGPEYPVQKSAVRLAFPTECPKYCEERSLTVLQFASWQLHQFAERFADFHSLADDYTPFPAALVRRGIVRLLCRARRQRAAARLPLLPVMLVEAT